MTLFMLQVQLPVVHSFWNEYLKIELPPSTSSIQFSQHDLTSDGGTIDLGLLFFKTTGDGGSDVTNKTTVSSFVSCCVPTFFFFMGDGGRRDNGGDVSISSSSIL